MEPSKEYHDPDYPDTLLTVKEEVETPSEAEKVRKIKAIVRREFSKEIEAREKEIRTIDQRATSARHLLHRLRCVLVSRYYQQQRLQLSGSAVQDEVAAQHEPRGKAEVSALLRDGQRRLHPSVRKLLGKKTVDIEEIFKHRSPRKKSRPDYSAMVQTRNYTISADKTTSLRPDSKPEDLKRPSIEDSRPSTEERPKKVPRQLDPKVENVVTLDEVTRNRQKHRYRIIIGNTSKYAPAASAVDASTHKWLLYVRHTDVTRNEAEAARNAVEQARNAAETARNAEELARDAQAVVTGVTVELHHSYAPHHKVHVDKPPYQISRRGWGEFPAKVTLHFALPERNKPATVEHTIKLDRNYTGLQTLGAETIVDVWLYSTQEMLKYEFNDKIEEPPEIKAELPDNRENIENIVSDIPIDPNQHADSWLDFFKNDNTELDVDEMFIKAVKRECDFDTLIESNVIEKETENSDNNLDLSLVKEEIHEALEVKENQNALTSLADTIPNEILSQPTTPKKRIMKYMDPTTGKIYYLEMDRALDLSKVQEIVINSKGNVKTAKISPIRSNGLKNVRKTSKKGVSLLKPEINNLLKSEKKEKELVKVRNSFKHIENDHCYLGQRWTQSFFSNAEPELPVAKNADSVAAKDGFMVENKVNVYDKLVINVKRFSCVRVAVNYLLSKIPLICDSSRDPELARHFPFVVENEDRYWRLEFAKRRNIEWSRAKLINRILTQHTDLTPIWRTKQILLFSRLHGYYPMRKEQDSFLDTDWYIYTENNRKDSLSKEIIPTSLSIFDPSEFPVNNSSVVDLTQADEEVDVLCDSPVKVKREVLPEIDNLQVLPVENDDDRLRFMFIEKKCADIGIELRNEDVGNGYSYSAVHAVLLTAMKKYAEEIIRSALAAKLTGDRTADDPPMPVWTSSPRSPVSLPTTLAALRHTPRLHSITSRGLAPPKHEPI